MGEILRDLNDVKVETENDGGCDGEGLTVIDNSVPSSVASEVDHQVCKDVIESLVSLEEKKFIDERVKERITSTSNSFIPNSSAAALAFSRLHVMVSSIS